MKVISGGQTGVDRAALDAAMALKVPYGGWCPAGRLAEDGIIPDLYVLQETPSSDYKQRTEWNVRDSDGTLIISWGTPRGGSQFTIECCQKLKKPYFVVDMMKTNHGADVQRWLKEKKIFILNVAGPRESAEPGEIQKRAAEFLRDLLKVIL